MHVNLICIFSHFSTKVSSVVTTAAT